MIALVPFVKDLLPILVEKIAEIQGKPTLTSLKKENEELKENLSLLEKKVYWIALFLVIQNILIIILFVIFLNTIFLK